MGGALIAKQDVVADAAEPESMSAGADDQAESLAPNVAFGWRLGPTPTSRWSVGARVEGFALTEKDRGGGALGGVGHAGVRVSRLFAEVAIGFGALGLASFDAGEATPALLLGLNAGVPLGSSFRLHILRVQVASAVLRDRTELDSGGFFGAGLEWTPGDLPPEERGLVD